MFIYTKRQEQPCSRANHPTKKEEKERQKSQKDREEERERTDQKAPKLECQEEVCVNAFDEEFQGVGIHLAFNRPDVVIEERE